MRTMSWDLIQTLYSAMLPLTGVNQDRWKLRAYLSSGGVKMKERRMRDSFAIQQPIDDADRQATDWCLRLIPPHTSHQARDIVIDTNDEHFEIVIGKTRRPVLINVGDHCEPLSIHHLNAIEHLAAEIQTLIEQVRAA